jgi:hypothetical protein
MGGKSRVGNAAAIGCGGLFAAVWIIGWSAGTLFFDFMSVRGIVMQTLAGDYPSVPGKVIDCRVESHSDGEGGTSYSTKLRYEYFVNDQRFEGKRLRFGMESHGGRKGSAHYVREHPPGTPVTVYYDPAKPSSAILEPGVAGTDLFMILFLTPFNVIMLGSWVFAVGCLAKVRSAERRFMRRVMQRGATTIVRMPGLSPVTVGALTAMGISFVLVFVVGFSTGMRPSIIVCTAALLITAAGAIWAGKKASRNLLAGNRDLEIDPIRRTVTFPLRKRQQRRTTIGLDQINGMDVKRKVTKSEDDSTKIRFVPTIRWTHHSGTPHTTGLGQFDDESEARALAGWLGRQVGAGLELTGAASGAHLTSPAGT